MDRQIKTFIENTRIQISALRKALDGLDGQLSEMEAKEAQPRRRRNLRQERLIEIAAHFDKYEARKSNKS